VSFSRAWHLDNLPAFEFEEPIPILGTMNEVEELDGGHR